MMKDETKALRAIADGLKSIDEALDLLRAKAEASRRQTAKYAREISTLLNRLIQALESRP